MYKKMNRRGGLDRQIIFVLTLVVIFACVIFIIWGAATVFPLAVGSGQEITSTINDAIQTTDSGTPLGNASAAATNVASGVLGSIEFIVYAVMIGLFLGYLAICYYVRTLKILAAIWFIVIVLMVVAAMIVSNAYITAAADPTLGNFYQTWGSNDFMMRNLPFITGIVGVFSGLFLFVIMQREPEEEDSAL